MLGWILLLGLPLIVFVLAAIFHYNRFQTLENRCEESWSNVDTELLRRHNLIPNLVKTVKAYAKHEKDVLQAATDARSLATQNNLRPKEAQGVERKLGTAIGKLLAVAEAYPDLKASKNFLELQEELVITEDRIQAARRFYNGNVRDQRNATRQFPGNLFASWFKPMKQDYFQVEAAVKAPVQVSP